MTSLIVATLNRVNELERLLTSLDGQSYKDFEVIVVDQNPDDRLVPVLGKHSGLSIHHLRSGRGLSRARNVGLAVAKGDIMAFPDDDCWYPKRLLETVTEWFEIHPQFDSLFTGIRTEENKPLAPQWAPGPCRCTVENILYCGASVTAFMRRRLMEAVGFFNEGIGQGAPTRYQSGEDLDYFIRFAERGWQGWYEPSFTVHHPELQSIERFRRTSHSYALGVGYVLRLHRYSWWCLSKFLIRSCGGATVSLCKGDMPRAHAYFLRAAGQLRGYVFGPSELAKMTDSAARATHT
jgi:glycosyltransferase involved in cell wall biosynthesis